MRVCIVCKPEASGWILGKMPQKLLEELENAGMTVRISESPDPNAEVNHYMLFLDYDPKQRSLVDSLMITHIDRLEKLETIKNQMAYAKLGICMSKETMQLLINYGIDPQKLCYINPAHDNIIQPRKLLIGLTSKIYADGRKREQLLLKLADKADPSVFSFKIMGEGWNEVIQYLRNKGFDVSYYEHFDYNIYVKLIPELDYYVYTGQDEGSMGFVDALSAGVKTIVTPQGYHLDVPSGITYSFNTAEELIKIFTLIAEDKNKRINSVKYWTWEHYAIKHIGVWKYA